VARTVRGQPLQQLEAQLAALPGRHTGMRLIDNDALRRDGEKVLSVPLALAVVEADHHDRVLVEQARAVRQLPFELVHCGRSQRHSAEMEVLSEFLLPLIDEVRRAEHGDAADLAPI